MKERILNQGFYADGRPAIAMWSEPRTIYQRADGTYYFVFRGKRFTVERRVDGSFYLETRASEK